MNYDRHLQYCLYPGYETPGPASATGEPCGPQSDSLMSDLSTFSKSVLGKAPGSSRVPRSSKAPWSSKAPGSSVLISSCLGDDGGKQRNTYSESGE